MILTRSQEILEDTWSSHVAVIPALFSESVGNMQIGEQENHEFLFVWRQKQCWFSLRFDLGSLRDMARLISRGHSLRSKENGAMFGPQKLARTLLKTMRQIMQ